MSEMDNDEAKSDANSFKAALIDACRNNKRVGTLLHNLTTSALPRQAIAGILYEVLRYEKLPPSYYEEIADFKRDIFKYIFTDVVDAEQLLREALTVQDSVFGRLCYLDQGVLADLVHGKTVRLVTQYLDALAARKVDRALKHTAPMQALLQLILSGELEGYYQHALQHKSALFEYIFQHYSKKDIDTLIRLMDTAYSDVNSPLGRFFYFKGDSLFLTAPDSRNVEALSIIQNVGEWLRANHIERVDAYFLSKTQQAEHLTSDDFRWLLDVLNDQKRQTLLLAHPEILAKPLEVTSGVVQPLMAAFIVQAKTGPMLGLMQLLNAVYETRPDWVLQHLETSFQGRASLSMLIAFERGKVITDHLVSLLDKIAASPKNVRWLKHHIDRVDETHNLAVLLADDARSETMQKYLGLIERFSKDDPGWAKKHLTRMESRQSFSITLAIFQDQAAIACYLNLVQQLGRDDPAWLKKQLSTVKGYDMTMKSVLEERFGKLPLYDKIASEVAEPNSELQKVFTLFPKRVKNVSPQEELNDDKKNKYDDEFKL